MIGAISAEFNKSYILGFGSINLNLVLIALLYFANTFVFIYQNRKSVYTYVSPYVVIPVLFVILFCTIKTGVLLDTVLAASTLLIYGLFLLFKNKYLNIAMKVVTYLALYLILLASWSTISYDMD